MGSNDPETTKKGLVARTKLGSSILLYMVNESAKKARSHYCTPIYYYCFLSFYNKIPWHCRLWKVFLLVFKTIDPRFRGQLKKYQE